MSRHQLMLFLLIVLLTSCAEKDVLVQIELPDHFPSLATPPDNTPTKARIALGQALFFDKNLSLDSTVSCRTCHDPQLAFSDGRKVSEGIKGRHSKRNAPSLINVGFLPLLNKDGGVKSLDIQALVPIEDENEMGISIVQLVKRLKGNEIYQDMAQKAYGDSLSAFAITRALATFVRTLNGGTSMYDRYLLGDSTALSAVALKGLQLFRSERLNCTGCHNGINLTNNTFANNGLYEKYTDLGRALITLDSMDIGKFRVPSLRNVAITSPYMHDGSLASLADVISHYEKRGIDPTRLQSEQLRSFKLTAADRVSLLAFLEALTDQSIPFTTPEL